MHKYLHSTNLAGFCRRVKDVIIICGSEYYKEEVQEAAGCLSIPTISGYTPWSHTHLDDVPTNGPFYATSPFSNYALRLCHENKVRGFDRMYSAIGLSPLEDDEDTFMVETLYAKNPYFSLELLRYLIVQVFSLGCLFDHTLITLNGYSISPDTNATSETWNKVCFMNNYKNPLI